MINIEKVEDGVRHIFKGDVFKSNGSLIGLSTQNFVLQYNRSDLKIIDLKEGFELLIDEFCTFYIWEKG